MSKHGIRGPTAVLRVISILMLIVAVFLWAPPAPPGQAARPARRSEAPAGTLTVAGAALGNQRWLPHPYVGGQDVLLQPLWGNLLSRDGQGNLIPMLAQK